MDGTVHGLRLRVARQARSIGVTHAAVIAEEIPMRSFAVRVVPSFVAFVVGSSAAAAYAQGGPSTLPVPVSPSTGSAGPSAPTRTTPTPAPVTTSAPASTVSPYAPPATAPRPSSGDGPTYPMGPSTPSDAPSGAFTAGDSTPLAPGKLPLRADGLTAAQVVERAQKTSRALKVDDAKLKAAAAAADLAWDAYLPRLTGKASYQELSKLPLSATTASFGGQGFSFPQELHNWSFGASLVVPLTDMVFKTYQQRASALSSSKAQEWTAKVDLAQVKFDAYSAFYNWVRAKGAVVVAVAALAQSEAHLKDLKSQLALKAATLADVYRQEAQVAAAHLTVTQAENLVIVSEESLRVLMHAGDDEAFHLGEDVAEELAPMGIDLKAIRAQALEKRPELQSIIAQIDASVSSAKAIESVAYPSLSLQGDVLDARANQRALIDPSHFYGTWDAGIFLSWSPNDLLLGLDSRKQADASTAQLKATREQIEDQLAIDVVTAFTKVREEESAIVSAGAQRRSAEEAYRVRVEQFHGGIATSSNLIDAESDLTVARLNDLNARVDLRIARVQLKKAIGDL